MTTAQALVTRPVAASLDELLAGVARREPFEPVETRSGVGFERVWIDGEALILKHVHPDDDFTLRAAGDIGCATVRAFAAGLLDAASGVVDHTVVGMARGVGRNGWGGAVLMRDATADLVPPGDDPFPEAQHEAFVDHLAAMCAATWGWRDDVGLLPYAARWSFFGAAAIDGERRLGWPERVPAVAADGWERFAVRAPGDVAAAVGELRHDLAPLVTALASTPSCFLHGDWKASNLGTAADGRTVLIDWVYLGEGPACHELGWYLALNRSKLPAGHTKERVIDDFRSALERHGVATDGWWARQLGLALLGTLVQFGWEKALGDDDELGWWCERARDGAALL
jgi:hypothetical protein